MVGRTSGRLKLFLAGVLGLTLIGVLWQRNSDAVLRVEQWSREIEIAAQESGLPDPFLLAGLVLAESRGQADAVSSIEAGGLCQLLPSTAEELARRHRIPGPPFLPRDNLRLGALYLREQMERWPDDVDLALLAYRLGPQRVQDAIREHGGAPLWIASLKAAKPSPWEYRTKVLRFRDRFAERAARGIGWSVRP